MSGMPQRCHDCAFTQGTEANRSERTRLTAELCLTAGVAFYCHSKGKPEPLCAGYVEALARQAEQPVWRRDVADGLLVLLDLASTPEACEAIADNFDKCFGAILSTVERRRIDSQLEVAG